MGFFENVVWFLLGSTWLNVTGVLSPLKAGVGSTRKKYDVRSAAAAAAGPSEESLPAVEDCDIVCYLVAEGSSRTGSGWEIYEQDIERV